MSNKTRDVTEHMTLGAIRWRDEENVKLILQYSAVEKAFSTVNEALSYMADVNNKILLKFGIDQLKMFEDSGLNPSYIKAEMQKPLERFHVNLPTMDPLVVDLINKIQALMDEKDLKTERRQYTEPVEDRWKSGMYFYHGNEIVYFISEPYRRKGGHYASPNIIVPAFRKWFILTNFKD